MRERGNGGKRGINYKWVCLIRSPFFFLPRDDSVSFE